MESHMNKKPLVTRFKQPYGGLTGKRVHHNPVRKRDTLALVQREKSQKKKQHKDASMRVGGG